MRNEGNLLVVEMPVSEAQTAGPLAGKLSVESLVRDGTIDQYQADVIDQEIDAGQWIPRNSRSAASSAKGKCARS